MRENDSTTSRLPTWEERTGGYQTTDEQGRTIRAQHSRFHGIIVSVEDRHGQSSAYLGDATEFLAWLHKQLPTPEDAA